MFEDKTLVCRDCGKEFVFTAGELLNSSSSLTRDSRTIPPAATSAALLAVTARTPIVLSARCTK